MTQSKRTTKMTFRAPVLLRRGQAVQMMKDHLVSIPSEWGIRMYLNGMSKEYFLKPVAYYILIKKRNSLYHKRDVEAFINWYNTKRLSQQLNKNESLEVSETPESEEIKSQKDQANIEAEVDTTRTSEDI